MRRNGLSTVSIMKAALINPPSNKNRMFGGLHCAGSNAAPLSLVSLAAAARAGGHDPAVIDAAAERLDPRGIARAVESLGAGAAGVTCMTFNFTDAAETCAEIKRANPRVVTIAGGVHVTSTAGDVLRRCPEIDVCVIGEGEITICELLSTIENGGSFEHTPGLAFRSRGGAVFTPRRPYVRDLDTLPLPAWDKLPRFPRAYNVQLQQIKDVPTISVITTRGCTAKCIFCDRSTFGNTVRGFSAPYIVQMLRDLKGRYGVRCVNFEDDNFMILKKRLVELCELLIRERMDVSWSCMARVDSVDAATLEIMKAAGCWMLIYGIETASDPLLSIMHKNAELGDTLRALRMTKQAGMRCKALLIAGAFGETRETLRQTRNFIRRAPLDDISMHYFTPLPATESYRLAPRYGTLNDDRGLMTFFNPVFVPNGLTQEDLTGHVRRCYLRFYLRPRTVISYLGRIGSPAYFRVLARSFFSFLAYCIQGLSRGGR